MTENQEKNGEKIERFIPNVNSDWLCFRADNGVLIYSTNCFSDAQNFFLFALKEKGYKIVLYDNTLRNFEKN